jgi:hypothetical protein
MSRSIWLSFIKFMSKKTAILVTIATVVIALLGLVAWFLFLSPSSSGNTPGNGVKDIFSAFFPSGSNTNTNNTGGTSTTTPIDNSGGQNAGGDDVVSATPAPTIRQITANPVSGFTIVEDKKSGPIARYMEIESGNVWSAPLSVLSKTRITNTTIPQTHQTFFTQSGKSLLTQYLGIDQATVKTFSATVHATTSSTGITSVGELQGSYLKDGIRDIVVSPAGDKIFYLMDSNIGTDGISANTDGSKPSKIFSSPIAGWLPQWTGSSIYVTSKASASTPGFLYSVNPASGAQTKILSGIYGLTTNVSPKNTALLYSSTGGRGIQLFAYTISTRAASSVFYATLPEKCAWDNTDSNIIYCAVPNALPSGVYPDSWYKGLVSFNDSLWKLNLKTGETQSLGKFSDVTDGEIDAVNLAVSKNNDYLVFINKNDQSLWSIKLK